MNNKITLPAIGSVFEGGFFAGDFVLNGERYLLIVAPKSEGERMSLQYKSKGRDVFDETASDDDGLTNSERINDNIHPAAQFCRALRIGSFDDWHLPARDDLMRLWMNLGPNRSYTPELFKKGGTEAFQDTWYWSSTEYAHTSSGAWVVGFYGGFQFYYGKYNLNGVRAVRRVKL